MQRIPVSRLSNEALTRELEESIAQDCPHTARQVALIGEVERRRLYAPAGYPSMYRYCVGKLRLSEDAAYKRIQVARAARRYPAVLAALADGRVHLTGLNLIAAHLKELDPALVDELLTAATHRTKKEIEQLLVERFPKADLKAEVRAIPQATPASGPTTGRPEQPQLDANTEGELAPAQVGDPVIPSHVESLHPAEPPARVAPLAPQRYGVQFTLDQAGLDLLQQVQDLLGHEVPRGDLAEVFVRALKAYAAVLEKQRHSATENPRTPRRQKSGSRHVAAHVKRAVRKRDKGQCTYVSESGHRCEARSDLHYDHIQPYARGGDATVSNVRLRCNAHNQYEAERTYGIEFMQHKRDEAMHERAAGGANVDTTASP